MSKDRPVAPDDLEMANECLYMIREKLASIIPMDGCPPMFYPEAIHNLYVWAVKSSRDCQRDHNGHDGDEQAMAKCVVEKVKQYAEKSE